MSNSIGARLAAARIEKSLSVSEVAQQVRIRNSVLQGIERDDYSLCGGEVYARGHISGGNMFRCGCEELVGQPESCRD